MFLPSSFWASTFAEWALILVTGAGAFASFLGGAGAVVIGILTFRLNMQTQRLQEQVRIQQENERRTRLENEYQQAVRDWRDREQSNEQMRYLAELSDSRYANFGGDVHFKVLRHPNAASTFTFMQTGDGLAHRVRLSDSSQPFRKEWERLNETDGDSLGYQDVLVAVMHAPGRDMDGTLVRITWQESTPAPDPPVGAVAWPTPEPGWRSHEQYVYIPPFVDQPHPLPPF